MHQFVHLRVHSEYSLVDGLVKIKALVAKTVAESMPAVALSDLNNLFGLIKFFKAARGAGIKPIIATDFYLDDEEPTIFTAIAMNAEGYANLRVLISRGWREGQRNDQAYVSRDWLEQYHEGLIILSGGVHGEVGRALQGANPHLAEDKLLWWQKTFGERYYLELSRAGRQGEEKYLHEAVSLAYKYDCPVVATNDVRFLTREEFEAHEARVCIHSSRTLDDSRRPRSYSDQQYFRNAAEMSELFSDIPEALENTINIAKRCNVDIPMGTYYLPDYPIPDGMEMGEFFKKISHEGLNERFDELFGGEANMSPEQIQEYRDRLDYEVNIILQMGFPGYFLIVMDFIQWAKDNDIPVGPGRGSGAGSLVAYAQKITDLDPLAYDLLFERFLNPERVSMPDFDVDFCMDKRDQVINYVAENYGRNSVSQIITYGTMAAKAVVRDVARVQGKPYGVGDKLSKMIPFEIGMTLAKAHEQEEPLREYLKMDEQGQEVWEMALQLEGITRGVGKHAGGVVIAPSDLSDFSPLYCDEDGGGLVTQYDKNDVEEVGLVKFDFLGLRTLTIIDWAVKMINNVAPADQQVDIASIPLNDKATFNLLQKAETTAVFQLESRGMKDLIKRLLPSSFEDIIALVALFRPGPLQSGMVDDFINRKHGRAPVAYPHEKYQHEELKPVLEPTYGIILYQEQVMQIAQVLANFSLGGADLLRRAMGKKKAEEMAKQRKIFNEGAVARDIDIDLANNIFDLMEKFAGYGFNKSHSAAYALVSYQTAWLKMHYPAYFMAAVMSSDMQNTDKVVTLIDECRNMKLPLLLPDVNSSEFMFTVNANQEVVYGLGAIKGLGEGPVEAITTARNAGGPFKDLFDFYERVDSKKINKRSIEALIRSGALDCFGEHREVLMSALPDAAKAADQQASNKAAGMNDMFGMFDTEEVEVDVYADHRNARRWKPREKLDGERDTLGLYLTGHPIDEHAAELKKLTSCQLKNLVPDKKTQIVAGLILSIRVMKSKRGDSMAFAVLDDNTARVEVAFFADAYQQCANQLVKDQIILVEGVASLDDRSNQPKIRAMKLISVAELRRHRIKRVLFNLQKDTDKNTLLPMLSQRSEDDAGRFPRLIMCYNNHLAKGEIALSEQWRIGLDDDSLNQLRQCLGGNGLSLEFY